MKASSLASTLSVALLLSGSGALIVPSHDAVAAAVKFQVEEATLEQIQKALQSKQLTTVELVNLYLQRIKAYNGQCANQPQGILGAATTIANAGQINALSTLNLRPATRKSWGFDDRKARSMTDAVD